MKKLRNQNGVITMVTLITILFMISFLITTYVLISNKVKTQKEMLAEIKAIYEPKNSMEEIYNSYFTNGDIIPIYTVDELLKIGSNENGIINGKSYTYSDSANYLLMNDLEFIDDDWLAPYENEEFTGNFEWNGHVIKVTTSAGITTTYDGKYLVTMNTNGNSSVLSDAVKSNLVNYKIEGNSVQNGEPSPDTPVEIQSVGDETVNLFDINNYITKSCLAFDTSNLVEGEQYTFVSNKPISWFKISNSSGGYNSVQKDSFQNGFTNFTFTMARNTNINENATQYIFIGIGSHEDGFVTDITQLDGYNIQIQKGAVATEYEPYGKYKIPIIVSGKNLCSNKYLIYSNYNKFTIKNNSITTTGGAYIGFLANVEPNTTYTVSYLQETEEYAGSLAQRVREYSAYPTSWEDNYIQMTVNKWVKKQGVLKTTFTTGPNTEYITFGFYCDQEGLKLSNFQVELGDNATKFIPYQEAITTNIYIDEPLRKVGEYSDYIDFANRKLVRRAEVLDNTGALTIEESYQGLDFPVESTLELPDIQLYRGTNTIMVDTKVKPSNTSITYNAKQ